MPVAVVRAGAGEVGPLDDAPGEARDRVDAGVDDRDVLACAGAEQAAVGGLTDAERARAARLRRRTGVGLNRGVGRDAVPVASKGGARRGARTPDGAAVG